MGDDSDKGELERHDDLRRWIELVEEDNAAANERLRLLTGENERLQRDLAAAVADRESAARRLQIASDMRDEILRLETQVRSLTAALEDVRALRGFPRDVPSVVALAGGVFADRLAFTDHALKSAARASLNDAPAKMSLVWRCLQSMASVLHRLHFPAPGSQIEPGTIPQRFERATGFELSAGEGAMTRKHPRLMRLRRATYQGELLDVSAHVKVSSATHFLRVHYHPHQRERRLLIDHCGDHVATAGTRRRS